jgi:methionyl-tRNA formyltransferase
VRAPEFIQQIADLGPEVIVVVAYGRILPPEILAIPRRWCINVHASILPKHRGAAPIARAIMAGEKVTGVTTMKMDRGLDTGDILLQRECAIGLTETAGELTARLAELGADLLLETLERHRRGELEPKRQDAREATLAPPLTREDGHIDWSDGAQSIACRILGCNPWPLAVADLRGAPVQLLRAEVDFGPAAARDAAAHPGEVVLAAGGRITVQCRGDGRLSLLELRFPGGRAMSARDALNGRLVSHGDRFAPAPAI